MSDAAPVPRESVWERIALVGAGFVICVGCFLLAATLLAVVILQREWNVAAFAAVALGGGFYGLELFLRGVIGRTYAALRKATRIALARGLSGVGVFLALLAAQTRSWELALGAATVGLVAAWAWQEGLRAGKRTQT